MTDTLIDHADSGEIPRYDTLGDDPTRNLADERDKILGATGRIRHATGEYPAVTDRIPETIGVVDPFGVRLAEYDMAAAQPVSPWERIVDTEQLSILDSLVPDGLATPPATPPPLPTPPRPDRPGKYLLREGWPPERIDPPGVRDRLRHKGAHRPYRSPSVARKRHPVRGLVWLTVAVAVVVAGLWPVFS